MELAKTPSFSFGALEVLPASLEVAGPSGRITLQRQVMRVLVRLMQDRGKVVSRQTLFEDCWAGRTVGEESLNRCIAAIRRALEDAVTVSTVPGVGYRLEQEVAEAARQGTVVSGPWKSSAVISSGEGGPPSLAVMPLRSDSGIAEDDAFGSGITVDIVSALLKSTSSRVIAGETIAGESAVIDADFLARAQALDIRYLLDGTLKQAKGQFLVSVRLLDTSNAQIIWTARFDEARDKLASMQGKLSSRLAGAVGVKISVTEMERALKKPSDITAWEAVQRYMIAFRKIDEQSTELALAEGRRAVELAPDYALAHACLSVTKSIKHLFLMDNDPDWVEEVFQDGERALRLDDRDPEVLWRIGQAFSLNGDAHRAHPWSLRAVQFGPNNPLAHLSAGISYGLTDRPDDALDHFEEAETLMGDSFHLLWVHIFRITALVRAERYAEAEVRIDNLLALSPGYHAALLQKAVMAYHSGDVDAARRIVEPILALDLGAFSYRRNYGRMLAGSPSQHVYCEAIDALLPPHLR